MNNSEDKAATWTWYEIVKHKHPGWCCFLADLMYFMQQAYYGREYGDR